MKAYALYHVGDLHYEDREYPECPQGWAIVQVKASGICSSDIPRIFSKGTYHFPTVPGHEFSGIVDAVGSSSDSEWLGKRVSVFPLIPCRKCPQCAVGHYETCEHYDYIGSRRDGGYAEYVAVPVWNLVEVPDRVSFSTSALFEPLSVALHAVKRIDKLSGRAVAVVGTGMIGLSAAHWAKKLGAARVTIVGRSKEKQRIVERLEGIEYDCDATELNADAVIEAVGTPQSIETAIWNVTTGGELVLMGNPTGDIMLKQDVYWKILRKQLHLYGTWNSQYDGVNPSDWTEVVQAAAADSLPTAGLITHYFDQEELPKALTLMREHKEIYCKVMTLWGGSERD